MISVTVFKRMLEVLPIAAEDVACWFPNGKNCIRVRTAVYGDFIFTYKNKKEWKLESMESYLNSIKVEV